jgi:hypothetical protein
MHARNNHKATVQGCSQNEEANLSCLKKLVDIKQHVWIGQHTQAINVPRDNHSWLKPMSDRDENAQSWKDNRL